MSLDTSSAASPAVSARKARRTVIGVVASDKMDKTIQVLVSRDFKHPKYEKRIRRSAKYAAHDENNEAKTGDTVEIAECRRLSKTKTWRFVKILKKSV